MEANTLLRSEALTVFASNFKAEIIRYHSVIIIIGLGNNKRFTK